MEDNKETLINAALFTLGWILAKHGKDNEAAYFLSNALKLNGVESVYVDDVLKAHEKKNVE